MRPRFSPRQSAGFLHHADDRHHLSMPPPHTAVADPVSRKAATIPGITTGAIASPAGLTRMIRKCRQCAARAASVAMIRGAGLGRRIQVHSRPPVCGAGAAATMPGNHPRLSRTAPTLQSRKGRTKDVRSAIGHGCVCRTPNSRKQHRSRPRRRTIRRGSSTSAGGGGCNHTPRSDQTDNPHPQQHHPPSASVLHRSRAATPSSGHVARQGDQVRGRRSNPRAPEPWHRPRRHCIRPHIPGSIQKNPSNPAGGHVNSTRRQDHDASP